MNVTIVTFMMKLCSIVKLFCSNMKKTTLRKVRDALQMLEPKVVVPEEIRYKAEIGLRKMLEICG